MRTRCGGEGEAVCPQSWSRDPFSWSPLAWSASLFPNSSFSAGCFVLGLGSFVLDFFFFFFLVEGKTVGSFGQRGMGLSRSKLPCHK